MSGNQLEVRQNKWKTRCVCGNLVDTMSGNQLDARQNECKTQCICGNGIT